MAGRVPWKQQLGDGTELSETDDVYAERRSNRVGQGGKISSVSSKKGRDRGLLYEGPTSASTICPFHVLSTVM